MKTFQINVYSFNELDEKARVKAIDEHRYFLISIGNEVEGEDGEMQTEYPGWVNDEDVIEGIESNDFQYFKDGTMASVTNFVGEHPHAGESELTLHGEKYTIN